eukprot:TRINITY_DN648_c0_g4_i2.p1 TRINITY_DN648_c0_g4~~TRINITY_DN648_c0_g4_i2.p1  ORF type:complete len:740 (+),score=189.06 TRINITY_DN648_c0_g4_i2:279-2222(+)
MPSSTFRNLSNSEEALNRSSLWQRTIVDGMMAIEETDQQQQQPRMGTTQGLDNTFETSMQQQQQHQAQFQQPYTSHSHNHQHSSNNLTRKRKRMKQSTSGDHRTNTLQLQIATNEHSKQQQGMMDTAEYPIFHPSSTTSSSSHSHMPLQVHSGLEKTAFLIATSGCIRQYLLDPLSAHAIHLLTPTVIQKSYHPERRYLHPVPAVWIQSYDVNEAQVAISTTVEDPWENGFTGTQSDSESEDGNETMVFGSEMHPSSEGTEASGSLSSSSSSGNSFGSNRVIKSDMDLDLDADKANVVRHPVAAFYFRRVFIGSSQATVFLHIAEPNSVTGICHPFGVFESHPFKLITKPIKKYAARNNLFVRNSDAVCVMHRPKGSGTVYLKTAQDGNIGVNANAWEHFRVVSNGKPNMPLKFNSIVELVTDANTSTGPIRVIKIMSATSKGIFLDANASEFVLCHDNVAFMVCESEQDMDEDFEITKDSRFLSINVDVEPFMTSETPIWTSNEVWSLTQKCCWSLVSTAKKSFKFLYVNPFDTNVAPLTPFPLAESMVRQSTNTLEVHGENLTADLTVWLGTEPCVTRFISNNVLSWKVPQISDLMLDKDVPSFCDVKLELPITLSRSDGIVFPTELVFSFSTKKTHFQQKLLVH